MKIGLIGKDNHKGLGVLTEEYMRHLNIHRLMCVRSDRRQFDQALYVDDPDRHIEKFVEGLDLLIILELYYPLAFKLCRKKSIATILKVNFEFLPSGVGYSPTLFHCSSSLNFDKVREKNKVLIPDPVNTDLIKFKQRKKPKVFLHNAGTLGLMGANCTKEVIEAFQYVKSNSKLIVNSQKKLNVDIPKNVEFRHKTAPNYWELWGEGDVFLMPQKFRATSLPIQEAMANGMPVMTTDRQPFNEFCQFLVEPSGHKQVQDYCVIDLYSVDPKEIAKKVDEVAKMDITLHSRQAREYAESISWKTLKPEYEKMFKKAVDMV